MRLPKDPLVINIQRAMLLSGRLLRTCREMAKPTHGYRHTEVVGLWQRRFGVSVNRWSPSISSSEPQESLIVPEGNTLATRSSSCPESYFELSVKLHDVKYPQSNHNQ